MKDTDCLVCQDRLHRSRGKGDCRERIAASTVEGIVLRKSKSQFTKLLFLDVLYELKTRIGLLTKELIRGFHILQSSSDY
jgi:hypothetical protein